MPQKDKILITGSSGMLGIDLSKELERDYEVYGTDVLPLRGGSACPSAKLRTRPSSFVLHEFIEGDITDRPGIDAIVDKVRPAVVVHTAAWTDVDGCELDKEKALLINRDGTKNVASACKSAGAVMIYISTDFVFDGKKKDPYKESDKPRPLSAYGDSKLRGEEAVEGISDRYFILRTSWLYGRHGKNFVDTIIAKAKTGKVLKVVDDQAGSPTYAKDLAGAIRALLDKIVTSYGTYHVSNSGAVSWYDYAKEILKLTGSKTEVLPISSEALARPAKRPAMSVLDCSKFTEFTGYEMRPWREALKDYLREKGN